MGVDHTDNGTGSDVENIEKPPAKDGEAWRPAPDRPGAPGQPSRLDHRAAVAARRSPAEQPPPAAEKAEAEEKTADDDRLRDDRPPAAASGEDAEQQSDDDPGETDDAGGAEERPGTKRPEPGREKDTEDKPGKARVTDAQPEPGGEAEKPPASDVWEKFASKSATYELDGRQFGYRTWGEEFAARRASRDAARQRRLAAEAEAQGGPAERDEAPADEQANSADAGTSETGGAAAESDGVTETEIETGEKDDSGSGAADTGSTDAEITDQGDAWREHVDTMKAKWADLESEQTPDRPPEKSDEGEGLQGEAASEEAAEIFGDEPGSWRGEKGRYLNHEENHAVEGAFDRVSARETGISDELQLQEAEVDGAELVGLEYRLKGEERFKEKAAEQLAADLREDPREAAESIPDALRYTYQFSRDDYVRGYDEIKDRLERSGFEMVHSRNFWSDSEYKGINSRWRTADGQLFEVQFHTPESFEAKQLTHGAYGYIRNPNTDPRQVEKLADFQQEVSAGIPMPKGVLDISNYRREGY